MHSTSAENLHHPATPPPTVRLHRSKTFSGRRETFLSDSQSSFLDDKLTSSPIHRMSKNERNSQLVSIIVSSDDEELEQKKRFIEQIPVAQQENKFDEKIPVQINKEKRNSSSSKSKRKKSSIVEKVNKTPSPSPYKNNSTISMKSEDSNNQKPFITVDISRARSNLEVVKLCLKELGWKEVTNGNISRIHRTFLFFSQRRVRSSTPIFIGIQLRFSRTIHNFLRLRAASINFPVRFVFVSFRRPNSRRFLFRFSHERTSSKNSFNSISQSHEGFVSARI